MSDATEVLVAMYDSLKLMRQPGLQGLPDSVFGLTVTESVKCKPCDKVLVLQHYVQHFHTVSAASLRQQAAADRARSGRRSSLGQLLLGIEKHTRKSCDVDKGAWLNLPWLSCCLSRCFVWRVWRWVVGKGGEGGGRGGGGGRC